MAIRGQTGTTTSIDLKTSVELKPLELSISPRGKVSISLPGLKVRLSEIKIGLLFLPFLYISGLEITTEPAELTINLSDTTIQTRLEKVSQVQVVTGGEIKASATLEGTGTASSSFRVEV